MTKIVAQHDVTRLVSLFDSSPDARRAHPPPDHLLPLLYALSATDARDPIRLPITGFDYGSISMRAVALG